MNLVEQRIVWLDRMGVGVGGVVVYLVYDAYFVNNKHKFMVSLNSSRPLQGK